MARAAHWPSCAVAGVLACSVGCAVVVRATAHGLVTSPLGVFYGILMPWALALMPPAVQGVIALWRRVRWSRALPGGWSEEDAMVAAW